MNDIRFFSFFKEKAIILLTLEFSTSWLFSNLIGAQRQRVKRLWWLVNACSASLRWTHIRYELSALVNHCLIYCNKNLPVTNCLLIVSTSILFDRKIRISNQSKSQMEHKIFVEYISNVLISFIIISGIKNPHVCVILTRVISKMSILRFEVVSFGIKIFFKNVEEH